MKIVTIDDDHSIQVIYDLMLSKGNECIQLANPDGLKDLKGIELIISDCQMITHTFRNTLEIAKQYHPKIPIIFTSGNYNILEELEEQGYQTLKKPFGVIDLRDVVKEVQYRK